MTARTAPPRRSAKRPHSRDLDAEEREAEKPAKHDLALLAGSGSLSSLDETEANAAGRYTFHHRQSHPYEVISFEDLDIYWRVLLPKGQYVNLRKNDVVRIEPIGRMTGYRTWVDKSGRYATVAKYVQYNPPLAEFAKLKGQSFSLEPTKLTETDFQMLKQIVIGCGKEPAAPRYFRSKSIEQIAAVADLCAIRNSLEWHVTAEVEKTTRGNKLIGNLWTFPVEITAYSKSHSANRDGAINELFASNFPDTDWQEIDHKQYTKLKMEYRTP